MRQIKGKPGSSDMLLGHVTRLVLVHMHLRGTIHHESEHSFFFTHYLYPMTYPDGRVYMIEQHCAIYLHCFVLNPILINFKILFILSPAITVEVNAILKVDV